MYYHVPSGPQKEITSSNHQFSGSIILNKPKLKTWIFPARLLIQMIRQVPLRSACGPGPKFFEMQVRVFISRPPWRKTHRERKKGSKVSKYQSYLNIKDIQNVLIDVMNAAALFEHSSFIFFQNCVGETANPIDAMLMVVPVSAQKQHHMSSASLL